MSIKKMLLAAVMALAAIAFAAPAAQADVTLTDPKGKALKEGAEVTVTSTNLETTTGGGDGLVCDLVTLHLEVTNPGPEHVVLQEVEEHGSITTQGCGTTSGLFVTIETPNIKEVTIDTWGAVTISEATFASHLFFDEAHTETAITCHFVGDVFGHATDETDEIHLTDSTLLETGTPGCPPQGVMHGTATIETKDKTPVLIDFNTTP